MIQINSPSCRGWVEGKGEKISYSFTGEALHQTHAERPHVCKRWYPFYILIVSSLSLLAGVCGLGYALSFFYTLFMPPNSLFFSAGLHTSSSCLLCLQWYLYSECLHQARIAWSSGNLERMPATGVFVFWLRTATVYGWYPPFLPPPISDHISASPAQKMAQQSRYWVDTFSDPIQDFLHCWLLNFINCFMHCFMV